MRIEEHTIEIDGVKTRYLEAGTGPALVLLHGIGESGIDWNGVIPMLTRNRHVIALDLPNTTGMSSSRDRDIGQGYRTFEQFARVVVQFLSLLEIDRAVLVGHSQGGLVAIITAIHYPDRVEALGLIDSAGLGRDITSALRILTIPGVGDLLVSLGGTPLGALHRVWARSFLLFANPLRVPLDWWAEQYRLARTPRFLSSTLSALRDGTDIGGQTVILMDQLLEIEIPVLVVWGEMDQIVPAFHARQAYQWIPDGQIAIIPGCGHMPHVEMPTEFAEVLKTFLLEDVKPQASA